MLCRVFRWIVWLAVVLGAFAAAQAAVIRSWDNSNQRGGDLNSGGGGDFEYGYFKAILLSRGHTVLPGVSNLTAANLAGVDVFFQGTSNRTLGPVEGLVLRDFVTGGGSVIVEVNSDPNEQNAGNVLLSALGLGDPYSGVTGGDQGPSVGTFDNAVTTTTVGPLGDLRGQSFGSSFCAELLPGPGTVVGRNDIISMVEFVPIPGGGRVLAVGDPYGFNLFMNPASLYYNQNNANAYLNFIEGGNRDPDCSTAVPSITELWPPNQRLVPVSITGVTDPDGDAVTVNVTGVTQDEPSNGAGDGDTCPDAVLDNGEVLLRAERSGTGNGRVYTVHFTANDGNGGSCSGAVRVCVPHDQRPGHACVDDGQTVNSLDPCGSGGPPRPAAAGMKVSFARTGSPRATLEYSLVEPADVNLAVFDVAGRRVADLVRAHQTAGQHAAIFDGTGLSSGVYFARLQAGARIETTRLVFLR